MLNNGPGDQGLIPWRIISKTQENGEIGVINIGETACLL